MHYLTGYQLAETAFYQNERSRIFHGIRISDGESVIVKTSRSEFPSVKELNLLQREFKIGQECSHPNVIKYFSLERYERGWALVSEDFGAVSLAHYLSTQVINITLFLKISLQLAAAIHALHRLGVVHKNINPKNILINETSFEVQ